MAWYCYFLCHSGILGVQISHPDAAFDKFILRLRGLASVAPSTAGHNVANLISLGIVHSIQPMA